MISNDKNIERIADFVEEAKEWLSLKKEYGKLDMIDKIVRIFTALALVFIFTIIIFLVFIYLSFAMAYFIGDVIGSMPIAFCCVSAFYVLILFLFYANRHAWIEKPMIKFLVSILLEKE
ncbi:MAG: phage holin family protein [Prevotella sp.]|nr:phage holin family protein [Candidatus Prevotella equi]